MTQPITVEPSKRLMTKIRPTSGTPRIDAITDGRKYSITAKVIRMTSKTTETGETATIRTDHRPPRYRRQGFRTEARVTERCGKAAANRADCLTPAQRSQTEEEPSDAPEASGNDHRRDRAL